MAEQGTSWEEETSGRSAGETWEERVAGEEANAPPVEVEPTE